MRLDSLRELVILANLCGAENWRNAFLNAAQQ
jgi:hypothetical protein